ncbi:two pore segment channel 3 isoform X5 [Stigmatopora argus]
MDAGEPKVNQMLPNPRKAPGNPQKRIPNLQSVKAEWPKMRPNPRECGAQGGTAAWPLLNCAPACFSADANGHDHLRRPARRRRGLPALVASAATAPVGQRDGGETAAQGLPKHPKRPAADLFRLPALHLQHPHLLAHGAQTLWQARPEDGGRRAVLLQLRRRRLRSLRAGHHGQQPRRHDARLQRGLGLCHLLHRLHPGQHLHLHVRLSRRGLQQLQEVLEGRSAANGAGQAAQDGAGLRRAAGAGRGRRAAGRAAFAQLCDLLNIPVIALKSRPHPLGRLCPAFYRSTASRLLRRLVRHRAFALAYDVIIAINAVFIGLDEDDPDVANSEWAFLALYVLEILLKLYVIEPRSFFSRHSFWNWFDAVIVAFALVATVVNAALESSGAYTSRQILDIVLILRVLRLVRVVDSVQRFRAIVNTLIRIGPAVLTFAQLILVVYYVFAVVGMELFKGQVRFFSDPDAPGRADCGNALLRGSAFAKLQYCKNNFNDVLSSFVLLLELTVVNQWHVLSGGFAAVTHKTARIYFVLFHVTVVIVIINIFVAFVLEAFFLEYSLDKSDLHTELERRIEELRLGVAQEAAEDQPADGEDESRGEPSENAKPPQLLFKIASKSRHAVAAAAASAVASLLDAVCRPRVPDGGRPAAAPVRGGLGALGRRRWRRRR